MIIDVNFLNMKRFDIITDKEIAYFENWINNRSMKILNYMTPEQVFQLHSVAIAS